MTLPDPLQQAASKANSVAADPIGAGVQQLNSLRKSRSSPQSGSSHGIDLSKLAEKIVEKLRREIGLENERNGWG